MYSSTPTSLGSGYTHDDIDIDNDSDTNPRNSNFSVDDTKSEEFRTPLNTHDDSLKFK